MPRLLFAVALAVLSPSVAHAAATECVGPRLVLRSSRLAGQVFHREGVPFAGARVTVTSYGREILDIPTDDRGYFEAPGVTGGRGRVRVSGLGFESVEIPWEINARLPFRLLAVRLEIGMMCDSRVCLVMLPAPSPLSRTPKCLGPPPPVPVRNERSPHPVLLSPALTNPQGLLLAAARKLDDRSRAQRIYEQVARTPGHGRWLWADLAVRELTDQRLVAHFALTDQLFSVRAAAVDRLSDQAVLARIARSGDGPWIRIIAVRKLSDVSLLSRLARPDTDWWVRQAAQERLKDVRRR